MPIWAKVYLFFNLVYTNTYYLLLFQFHHQVLRISRETKVWKLIIKDLRRNTLKHYHFDVIVLCNGWAKTTEILLLRKHEHLYFNENPFIFVTQNSFRRFSKPQLPEIIGAETFGGDQIHSHYYRRNDRYKDKRLLIVGAAISGQDISTECSKVAKKVRNPTESLWHERYNCDSLLKDLPMRKSNYSEDQETWQLFNTLGKGGKWLIAR